MKLKWLIILAASFLAFHSYAQFAEFGESTHYRVIRIPLDPPKTEPGKVEVTELFSYACVHCYEFEEPLKEWLERQASRVDFKRVHVVFSSTALPLARAYYAAEELDVVDEIHGPLFSAIHINRLRMHQVPLLVRLFESRAGVSAEDFTKAYESFNVENQLRLSNRMVQAWRIDGTPSLVVDGRYVAGGTSARTHSQRLAVVDYLIQKVLDERN